MLNSFNILCVDDSAMSLTHLKHILSKEGYNVTTADGGKAALSEVEKSLPDLILLDIEMPDMNGFLVIEELKKNMQTHNIPVIFLTGNDDHESKQKAFSLGAVDYIVKPFQPYEVKARAKVHLKLSVATKSIIESQAAKLKQIKDAQESILIKPEDLPEAKFSVYFNSLSEAGGDFYDVLKISDDLFTYFVADVSGHDIATSYISPAVKALLKQNSSPIYTSEETVGMMNQVLSKTLPGDKYLTAFYLRLNRKTGKISFINAGHPPAIYIPADGSKPQVLSTEGDLIGMFENAFYESKELDVKKGDKIVLYTDGLVEIADSTSVWSNEYEKIIPVVEKFRHSSYQELPQILVDELIGGKVTDDDVIVFVLEV